MGRSLVAAAVIGAFLGMTGAYGTERLPLPQRFVLTIGLSLIATLLGTIASLVVGRSPRIAARWWLRGLLAALAMTLPMGLAVWAALQLVMRPAPPVAAIPAFMPISLGSSLFFCLWAALLTRPRPGAQAAAGRATGNAPKFLERLPPKLHGAELWAVEAEDHYLRLHTSKGQDLVLMRLSDAVAELEGLEGAQTHRSWWVARDAIGEVRRADGRAVLTLKNGVKAPVSRTHARALRARGWL